MRVKFLFSVASIFALSIFLAGCSKENGDDSSPSQPSSNYFPVLIENFTNTYCDGCVAVHEALEMVMNHYNSEGKSPVLVEFHSQLNPSDPFYSADPSMHSSRNGYYGFGSWPQLVIDGYVLTSDERTSADEIKAIIDSANVQGKPAEVQVEVSSSNDSVYVSLSIDATEEVIGNLFCYLVRQVTTFETAPGSNGITEYHCVAALSFTDPYGQAIAIPSGESEELSFDDAIPAEVSGGATEGYSVVAFIQGPDNEIMCVGAMDLD